MNKCNLIKVKEIKNKIKIVTVTKEQKEIKVIQLRAKECSTELPSKQNTSNFTKMLKNVKKYITYRVSQKSRTISCKHNRMMRDFWDTLYNYN